MSVDPELPTLHQDKLLEFASTLTDDQTRLLREGLAEGDPLDLDSLIRVLTTHENHELFRRLVRSTEPGLTRW